MTTEPRVVLEDAALVVLDKPPGWLVIPGRGVPEPTLRAWAQDRFGPVWVVHRLDRGTSGLVVFARTAKAHRALNMAFEQRKVQKRYLALVRGSPPADFRADVALAPARKGRMRPARPGDAGAKSAATRFHVIEALRNAALVEAEPETGRTHQIRVHLAGQGFPLLFDPDYGSVEPVRDRSGKVVLARTPLHASRLELAHPSNGSGLVAEAPMPDDMDAALRELR